MSFAISHTGTWTTSRCLSCGLTYSERMGDLGRQQATHTLEACTLRRQPPPAPVYVAPVVIDRRWGHLTHCVNKHEYTPENTHINKQGIKVCRICERRRGARYRARIKALERVS